MIEYENWFYGINKIKRKGKHEGFDCSVMYEGENSNYGTNRLVQLKIVNYHITLQDQSIRLQSIRKLSPSGNGSES